MYLIIRLFTHYKRFVPEIVPLWLKNRNQRGHSGVTQVLRKRWAYLRWVYTGGGGGGGLIGGEIWYSRLQKGSQMYAIFTSHISFEN